MDHAESSPGGVSTHEQLGRIKSAGFKVLPNLIQRRDVIGSLGGLAEDIIQFKRRVCPGWKKFTGYGDPTGIQNIRNLHERHLI